MKLYLFAFAALILSLGHLPAMAQNNPENQDVRIQGTCETVIVNGTRDTCVKPFVMYSHLANGVVLIGVAISQDRVLAFIGEKDSQPNLTQYHLYLSRARIDSHGSSYVTQLAGDCIVSMTTDGRIWKRVDCNAKDEHDKVFRLNFASDEQPVQVLRSKPD